MTTWPTEASAAFSSTSASTETSYEATERDATRARINQLGIQMISKSLHKQIFGEEPRTSDAAITKSRRHLAAHGIYADDTGCERSPERLRDVDVTLPPLTGRNVNEHFVNVARKQIEPYLSLAGDLAKATLPQMPKKWRFSAGWTKYDENGTTTVPYPDETSLVLDVEVCVRESERPVMATAVSRTHWYSWVSERLAGDRRDYDVEIHRQSATAENLIPLESRSDSDEENVSWKERIVVGHNVGYDRARIKEQYLMKVS